MSNPPNAFHVALNTPMSAKRLVLSLFAAFDDEELPIAKLIIAGEIFGIEDAAIRMAIKRLVKDGVMSSQSRGWYAIGERGKSLYEASRAWQRQNSRVKDWTGEWICIHESHLGRSNRQTLRARHRAYALYGFAELEQGLWIRPNNLTLPTKKLTEELIKVGLDHDAIVIEAKELIHDRAHRLGDLWDRGALESSYRSGLDSIRDSVSAIVGKPQAMAAREVLTIGSSVISILTHDPLLPDSFVDTNLRRELFDAMLEYNTLGKNIWISHFEEKQK